MFSIQYFAYLRSFVFAHILVAPDIESIRDTTDSLQPLQRRRRKKKIEKIGQIGAGRSTRRGIIDIAIVQSLFEEEKDVKSFVADYGMALCGILLMLRARLVSETRSSFITSDTVKLIEEGRTSLLLTERKEHGAQLAPKLHGKAKHVFLLLGSGGQKEKWEKLSALQAVPANETLAVIATGKYVGEGFDEPRWDTILLTMPTSWKGTLAQYVGWLHWNYEGKREVRVYDYVDVHTSQI